VIPRSHRDAKRAQSERCLVASAQATERAADAAAETAAGAMFLAAAVTPKCAAEGAAHHLLQ
jgi:hypothetical protein